MKKEDDSLLVFQEVKNKLNDKSPSFCLAKWLQVTIHLQNGHTHSCHHPQVHMIPLEEIAVDPSALHNTFKKKIARREMLSGERPTECDYCWKIEDAHPDNISDRPIKSSNSWAMDRIDEIKTLPWHTSVNPAYIEVSFGNECNFRCAYCAPHISSGIMTELKRFGDHPAIPFPMHYLEQNNLIPYGKDEHNPYVDAFWKWWPDAVKDLKVFRITGGEPLINQNTFKFLDYLRTNPLKNLTVAINSNLGIPKTTFQKFLKEAKYIVENKLVGELQLFTSVDTHGKNAEFVRFGLKYDEHLENAQTFLSEVPEAELIYMCTYNAFSVVNFRKFLEDIRDLKTNFRTLKGESRITLDIPYLRDPIFLSSYVLNESFFHYIKADIEFMEANRYDSKGREIFSEMEISKLVRTLRWLEQLEENNHRKSARKQLVAFLVEYCKRKEIKIEDYIPEYIDFLKECANY